MYSKAWQACKQQHRPANCNSRSGRHRAWPARPWNNSQHKSCLIAAQQRTAHSPACAACLVLEIDVGARLLGLEPPQRAVIRSRRLLLAAAAAPAPQRPCQQQALLSHTGPRSLSHRRQKCLPRCAPSSTVLPYCAQTCTAQPEGAPPGCPTPYPLTHTLPPPYLSNSSR